MKIVLASRSPSRRRLLSRSGLDFVCFDPNIREEDFFRPQSPGESCLEVAKQKALKAVKTYKRHIIIACDQMVWRKGQFFGKAHTEKRAFEVLSFLSGKTHTLFSGLFMLKGRETHCRIVKSQLTMRSLSDKQIRDYISMEKPLKSAGSYHIEARGISLFEKVETEDMNAIEGLPLVAVFNQLAKWGAVPWLKPAEKTLYPDHT